MYFACLRDVNYCDWCGHGRLGFPCPLQRDHPTYLLSYDVDAFL